MLGFQEKKKAEKKLKNAIQNYKELVDELNPKGEELHEIKSNETVLLLSEIEQYLEQLSGAPKEFEKSVSKFVSVQHNYEQEYRDLRNEHDFDPADHIGKGGGALAAGAAAAFAPQALMSIAMTFGTASTGTAISALSGAAATNAAVAWLGGGAVAAGGGGMGVGGAVLAGAGPVGWAIAGGFAIGTAVKVSSDNTKAVKKYSKNAARVEKTNSDLKTKISEVSTTIERLTQEVIYCLKLLSELREEAPNSYANFNKDNKQLLGNLINHVHMITALMER